MQIKRHAIILNYCRLKLWHALMIDKIICSSIDKDHSYYANNWGAISLVKLNEFVSGMSKKN